jgi:predicted polyphosphate/ATP-dependent NAD kinase
LCAAVETSLIIERYISGNARGADQLGEQWAKNHGFPVEVYPADWETHGRAAGVIRNQQMLETGVDLLIAFPGGRGTADMVRRARKAGVEVIEVS